MLYDPSRTWDIPLTDITLATENGYFLYVKVPIDEAVTSAEVFADEAHIDPLRDDGYIIYKQGYITPPINGVRQVSLIQGNVKSAIVKPSKVDFTGSNSPGIADFEPYLKHGPYPDIKLWQINTDGTESEMPSLPKITRVSGAITSVSFGVLPKAINGFILIR